MADTVKGILNEIRGIISSTKDLSWTSSPQVTLRNNCDKVEAKLLRVERLLGLVSTPCNLCGGDGKFQEYPENPPECPECKGTGITV